MIEQVTLRDGTDAFVVPLERTDRAALVAEFETLSPESQRRRFLAPVRHLSDAMLDHLVDDVDGVDHIALVLCAETSPDVYDPVALARMVRYADVTDAADLAVTVKDEWQGRGVATVLLEVLMRRRPRAWTASSPRCCRTTPRPWGCSAAWARCPSRTRATGCTASWSSSSTSPRPRRRS